MIKRQSGTVEIFVAEDEKTMGKMTAEAVADSLSQKHRQGFICVLWLMAAPSAFAFYHALIERAAQDGLLRDILKKAHFFQFDDYPIGRDSPKFPATFRYLLEEHFFIPLQKICGPLPNVHLLELDGTTKRDHETMVRYKQALLDLRAQNSYIVQLKGIGIDGHWGFHSAQTPLTMKPDIIQVPMNSQNIHQQCLDWPGLFPAPDDVPDTAVTFNVEMFMLADEIIDNVPQPSKEYAVLATYGSEKIINEIPSGALKRHKNAKAYLTQISAKALLEYLNGIEKNTGYKLSDKTRNRLWKIWENVENPAETARNIQIMEGVLKKLEMIA